MSLSSITRASACKPLAVLSFIAALSLLTACQSPAAPAQTPTPSSPEATSSAISESPANSQAAVSQAGESSQTPAPVARTHTVAGGTLSFSAPVDWTIEELALDEWQVSGPTALKLSISNADGQKLAELQTSFAPVLHPDFVPDAPSLPYKVIDEEELGLKHMLGSGYTKNTFMFESLGEGTDVQGSVALSMPSVDKPEKLQYLAAFAVNGEDGLRFGGLIEPDTQLTGVDKALKGDARLKAYMKTEEYKSLRAMLVSLKQIGKQQGSAEAKVTFGDPCLGSAFIYELEGSKLTCPEAKTFVLKIRDDGGGGAGGFDLVGFGGCYYDDKAEERFEKHLVCQSETSDDTFKILPRM